MKVLVINTGGTITMRGEPLRPASTAAELLRDLWRPEGMELILVNVRKMRDSGDVVILDLVEIAQNPIAKLYLEIDGVIVFAGTGQAARITAALNMIFKNTMQKPGLVTGSLFGPEEPGSDAPRQLENTLRVMDSFVMNNVVGWNYVWRSEVWLGSRLVKVSDIREQAFDTPGRLPVATIEPGRILLGRDIRLSDEILAQQGLRLDVKFERRIHSSVGVTADDDPWLLKAMVDSGKYRGIVLTVPDPPSREWPRKPHWSWIDAIGYATKRRVHIAIASPYPGSQVNLERYQLGRKAKLAGALSLENLTPAMAEVKFRQAVATHPNDRDKIQEFLSTNFVGELLT